MRENGFNESYLAEEFAGTHFLNGILRASSTEVSALTKAPAESPLEFGTVRSSLSPREAKFLSDVNVTIAVEIGNLMLSAEHLLDLRAGQCFEFAIAPDVPLSLKVGNVCVAFAKLVMCGENLALEIIGIPEEAGKK